jgi:hypothetical protein
MTLKEFKATEYLHVQSLINTADRRMWAYKPLGTPKGFGGAVIDEIDGGYRLDLGPLQAHLSKDKDALVEKLYNWLYPTEEEQAEPVKLEPLIIPDVDLAQLDTHRDVLDSLLMTDDLIHLPRHEQAALTYLATMRNDWSEKHYK